MSQLQKYQGSLSTTGDLDKNALSFQISQKLTLINPEKTS
jgi:hypothetical protein